MPRRRNTLGKHIKDDQISLVDFKAAYDSVSETAEYKISRKLTRTSVENYKGRSRVNELLTVEIAVSYTHLDVYKRQNYRTRRGRHG